ncbi:hypothetical protein [Jatrophihabitans sp.]|uniref:hypothetical protein n=1 Tax=Jatrophihabitans sp. TaxID=1932789 RepID=UPI0030C7263B|nr:hypothetical protein [Jatrophihabitans sp.]
MRSRHFARTRRGASPRRRRPASGDDSGFILIEAVVSSILFLIVAAAASAAVIIGIQSNGATSSRVGASNVAQQAIQQAVGTPRASLTAAPNATTTVTVGNQTYRVARSISYAPATSTGCPTAVNTSTPQVIVVHVSVAPVASSSRSVQMDTVIAC